MSPSLSRLSRMTCIGVTGATGFVGAALVRSLAARNYDLRAVDNRSGPVQAEHRQWPVPTLDFASDAALKLLADSDVLLHLAAVSGVMTCAKDPAGSAKVNLDGTRRLYGMCRERKIPVAFASSLAVVGAPEHLPVRETTPARPTHEYARQKAAGERLTAELAATGAVPTASLRQSNVYGGYQSDGRHITKSNVLELFAHQAFEGCLLVNAPGTQRRNFIHIQDVVAHWEAVVRFLLASPSSSSHTTFNVVSGETYSVREIADQVAAEFGRLFPGMPSVRLELVPNPRQGIELVEPSFAVDRSTTERLLGVSCERHLAIELHEILERAEPSRPTLH